MSRTDLEKWEGLTRKMGKSDSKNEKDWPKEMGRTESKSEENWLGKVGRTDRKKWEGLSREMRRTDVEKREGLNRKMRRTDLEKWEGLMGRSDSKHGRSLPKQGWSDSKTRPIWLQKRRSCWHLTAIVILISWAEVTFNQSIKFDLIKVDFCSRLLEDNWLYDLQLKC